jgi:hypothetical protein
MTAKTELSAPQRRTRAEVQQLVSEFVSSGMRRSEFCRSRGLSFSTLDRHLKKRRWKRRRRPASYLVSRNHDPGQQVRVRDSKGFIEWSGVMVRRTGVWNSF